jgi:hypothetical protein
MAGIYPKKLLRDYQKDISGKLHLRNPNSGIR